MSDLADKLEALAAQATSRDLMMYGEPDVGLRTEPFFGEPLKGNMQPLADWRGCDADLVVILWNNLPAIITALRAQEARAEPSEDLVGVAARTAQEAYVEQEYNLSRQWDNVAIAVLTAIAPALEAKGAAQRQAEIVAWLRGLSTEEKTEGWVTVAGWYERTANAIEAEEDRKV